MRRTLSQACCEDADHRLSLSSRSENDRPQPPFQRPRHGSAATIINGAMRANGVSEESNRLPKRLREVRGPETVPYTMRNPLYHWTHRTGPAVRDRPGAVAATAREIYDACNAALATDAFTAGVDAAVHPGGSGDDRRSGRFAGIPPRVVAGDFAVRVLPTASRPGVGRSRCGGLQRIPHGSKSVGRFFDRLSSVVGRVA